MFGRVYILAVIDKLSLVVFSERDGELVALYVSGCIDELGLSSSFQWFGESR